MNRLVLNEVVEQISLDDFVGTASEMIQTLTSMTEKYGEDVFIELSDGSYSGYYSIDVYRKRLQSDEEYALMVAQHEQKERKENSTQALAIIDKALSGKKITKKERSLLTKLGINIP